MNQWTRLMLTRRDALTRACQFGWIAGWDERRFTQALLDAYLSCYTPASAGALDSTDLSTWGRARYLKKAFAFSYLRITTLSMQNMQL